MEGWEREWSYHLSDQPWGFADPNSYMVFVWSILSLGCLASQMWAGVGELLKSGTHLALSKQNCDDSRALHLLKTDSRIKDLSSRAPQCAAYTSSLTVVVLGSPA